jgi:hypothetical protein
MSCICLNLAPVSHAIVAQPSRLRVSAGSAVTRTASETLAPRGLTSLVRNAGWLTLAARLKAELRTEAFAPWAALQTTLAEFQRV